MMFIRETEIDIEGEQVSVVYTVDEGEIDMLRIKFPHGTGTANASELLHITSVREALEAHHANLLEEDNA